MIKKLLVLVMMVAASALAQAQADSLGIERNGEQVLVIHKVKSGQTLYALARRYGTSVKQINDANAVLQQGLKVGQTLKIPYGKPLIVPKVTTPAKTHTVAAGETLYAISRKYNITVDELKKLNGLTSNALARGQKLVVQEAVVVQEPEETTPADSASTSAPAEIQPQEQASVDTTAQTATAEETAPAEAVEEAAPETVTYNGTPFTEVQEEGVAELIEEEEPTNKFLALHRTAKVGTVIKIRNLKNDLAVYVRVVGNIPETADNENVLIKINKRAHDQLKAIDPRLRVELTYFQ